MKSSVLDVIVALWVILAGAVFCLSSLLGVGGPELEMVTRCVYIVVLAAGLISLALRLLKRSPAS